MIKTELPSASADDVLAGWRASEVRVHQALPRANRHTLHSYFVTCPESPDGRHVLFYASTTPEGYEGEVRILERATGEERILARNVYVEDAHRGACQQWSQGGKTVVFHDCRENRWFVVAVDIESGRETVLAGDRQVGFGSATDAWAPLYGCHWNPGPHRDFELVHVETGEIRTAVKIREVATRYPEWIAKEFGPREISIFFPVISSNAERVFFKVSAASGLNDYQCPEASHREGKVVYDLKQGRFLHCFEHWGHPSWHPDSKRIFEVPNVLVDPKTGTVEKCLPLTQSDHPSFNPAGNLFTSDGKVLSVDKPWPGESGIVVASPGQDAYSLIHRFDNSKGARSWRKNHAHPVFSHDGQRIYFNVNAEDWTRLFVAEAGAGAPNSRFDLFHTG